jgi:hypothetical protein
MGKKEVRPDLPEKEAAVKASHACYCKRKVQRPTVGLGHVMHVKADANVGEPDGDEQACKKFSKVSGPVRFTLRIFIIFKNNAQGAVPNNLETPKNPFK